jgi:hypothetical protein
LATLLEARARGNRSTDSWRYGHAQVLDELASLAAHDPAHGRTWIVDLELLAGSAGMRELLVRAQLHRATLGEAGAFEAAVALADGIENPQLTRRLTRSPANVAAGSEQRGNRGHIDERVRGS